MRIFSEKRQITLESDSYAKAQQQGSVGCYNIHLTRKQAAMMDSRRFTLDVMGRANWVEDGFHIVIGQMLFSSDSLLPYLGIAYPSADLMAANECHTETKDERRTLLFRLRHMLRSLKTVKDRFELFEQWRFSGLEFAMQSFDYVIRQAFGEVAHDTFYDFYRRLRKLWKPVAPELDSPEDVEREIDSLIDQAEAVFATLKTAPGYATSKDLYFALYRLAKNYPEADHFQWLPNS